MAENELTIAFDDAWHRLRERVGKLGPEALERATSSGWSLKEMLAHIAFWDEATAPAVAMIVGDDALLDDWPGFASGFVAPDGAPWPHTDEHNAREAAWARGQAAEAVIDRLDTAHLQARAVIERLAAEGVNDDRVRRYVEDEKIGHYIEHLEDVPE